MTTSPRDDAGFSLVELLAALAVLVVVSVAVAGGLLSSARASATSKSRTVAAALAAQEIELARSLPQSALALGTTPPSQPGTDVGGRLYYVKRTVAWGSSAGVVNRCSGAGTGRYAFKRVTVTVTVTWLGMKGATPVTNETLITPPGGSGTPDTDSQRVQVINASGAPVQGAQVVLAGSSGSTNQLTDAYGCALFIDVVPGTYTVTVSRSGSVDPQGAAAATRTVAVAGTQTPPLVQVQLDAPGSVQVIATTPNAGFPVPAGLGGSVSNTLITGIRSSASGTIGGLFPFKNSSYLGWVGTCDDGAPRVYGLPSTAPAKVLSGTTAPLTAGTMPYMARVKLGTGASHTYNNSLMYAVHLSAGCGTTATVPGSPQTYGAVVPLTTDSQGLLKVSLPYGTWHFLPPPGSGHVYRTNPNNPVTLAPPGCDTSRYTCDTSPPARDVNIF